MQQDDPKSPQCLAYNEMYDDLCEAIEKSNDIPRIARKIKSVIGDHQMEKAVNAISFGRDVTIVVTQMLQPLQLKFRYERSAFYDFVDGLKAADHPTVNIVAEKMERLCSAKEGRKKVEIESVDHGTPMLPGERNPNIRDLLSFRTKDGKTLRIIPEITSYGSTACNDLCNFLMNDDGFTQRSLRRAGQHSQDDEGFMRAVFQKWLNSGDICTWETLRDCVEKTPDLPGALVKKIRDNFCS